MFNAEYENFGTDAIHAGQAPEKWNSHPVVPLIGLSTTFKQDEPGVLHENKWEYSRATNPTRECLEECVAKLENAQFSFALSSGLAATMTMVEALLEKGDHAVVGDDLYGGTNRYFNKVACRHGIEFDAVDVRNPELVRNAIKTNTKLVWFEAMSNPQLRIADVSAISSAVHEINKDIVVCVDNTFLTPFNVRYLDLGADVVMHSATKYMNGHSDVVMGLLSCNRLDVKERLKFTQYSVGGVPSPFDCYLVNRGLKTLHVRMPLHEENALAVAHFLDSHHLVEKVICPGLPSHPEHELLASFSRGISGMLGFYIKGKAINAKKFLESIKVFTLAESLGGFESLAEHPAIMTHASVPEAERAALGITDTYIRLSVGLESIDDLIKDLRQALEASTDKTHVSPWRRPSYQL